MYNLPQHANVLSVAINASDAHRSDLENDWDYFWLFVSVYPNCSLFNSLCRIDVVCTFYGPAVLEFLNGINLGASIFDMWHVNFFKVHTKC